MTNQKKKMLFEVLENESISECLDRIKQLGFVPIRRTEKPIFKEIEKNGEYVYEPIGRKIIFEAKNVD